MQNIQQQRVTGIENQEQQSPSGKKRSYAEFRKDNPQPDSASKDLSSRKQRKPSQTLKVESQIKAQGAMLKRQTTSGNGLKHSKLTFADLRKRKTQAAKSINQQTMISTLEEQQPSQDLLQASGQSLFGASSFNPTQLCDPTQMDVDQTAAGEGTTAQALGNRSSKLDAIMNLDASILKKTAERERLDKEQRLQEKYKVCATLPEDWTLKTEIEIQMPLKKPVEDISEVLNYKDVAKMLSYYIYQETQLPKFLQENQNAEYLRNADKISWVKSFKDAYQKFVASYQAYASSKQDVDDLEMPCFYLRSQSSIALFKIDQETGAPMAELIPSLTLAKAVKDKTNLNYSVQNIYEEDEDAEAAADYISGKPKSGAGTAGKPNLSKEESDEDHLDLNDLMDEMQDTINLAQKDNLKLGSMHHFKLKRRDVVQVFHFSGRQSCHSLYMLLLNYVSSVNEKRKNSRESTQTQIIAPRPFMDCLYKECTLTYKGIVETRTSKASGGSGSKAAAAASANSEYFDLKFNGIIFPQPIRRICNFSKAILKQNEGTLEHISVNFKSDSNSHPFSHKQLVRQVMVTQEDSYQLRID